MKVFLFVLFFVGGDWGMHPGFMPLPQPNLETCLERKDTAIENFRSQRENIPDFHVDCLVVEEGEAPNDAMRDYLEENNLGGQAYGTL